LERVGGNDRATTLWHVLCWAAYCCLDVQCTVTVAQVLARSSQHSAGSCISGRTPAGWEGASLILYSCNAGGSFSSELQHCRL